MISTLSVLAGAYRGRKDPTCLSHSIDSEAPKTLCGRIPADHMADGLADIVDGQLAYLDPDTTPPTCPRCLAKDPRFK